MKKAFFIFISTLLLIVLTSCISADLKYSLSDDNTMAINYRLAFDKPEQDVSPYLNEIGTYWANKGMAIYVDKDTKTLTGEKKQSFDSAEQAASAFADAITSQDTLFSDLTFAYTPSFSLDSYRFSANVSLADIIRQNESQSIPADQVTALESTINQGTYTLSITLPGEVTATNADSREGSTCTWNLIYGETKNLTMETQQENRANTDKYNELEGLVNRNNGLMVICGAAVGLCIIIIIASVLVRKIKRKRASEIRIKHFR